MSTHLPCSHRSAVCFTSVNVTTSSLFAGLPRSARFMGRQKCASTHRLRIANMCLVTSAPFSSRKWSCMSQCGACCKLDGFDKDVLSEMLGADEDVIAYLGMIGPDGWCKWYDPQSRTCSQYENRPRFCRATPQVFRQLYDVDESQFDDFAISCCQYHISNTYGEESMEAYRHDDFIMDTNS